MNDLEINHSDFLWRSFLDGDDRMFTVIYHQYAPLLLNYGNHFSVNREVIRDALQEVFTELYLRRGKLNVPINNVKGYLYVSFKNRLLKQIARENKLSVKDFSRDRENVFEFQPEYSFQEQWIRDEISEERRRKLHQAVNSLSSKQKEIIFLRFEEELEYPEIAGILNITVDSARKQLYRTLKSLQKTIDPEEFKLLIFLFFKKR